MTLTSDTNSILKYFRLTSTPQNESGISGHAVFSSPLTDNDGEDDGGRNILSLGDVDSQSSIEMELEMTCEISHAKNVSQESSEQTKDAEKKETFKSQTYLLRHTERRKKSHSVFVRLLKDAEYMVYKVFKYLSGLDLLHLSHVNQQLRRLILYNKKLNIKRLKFIHSTKQECERVGKVSI